MRMTLWASVGAGALALLVCFFSLVFISSTIGEIERMRVETLEYAADGRIPEARERLVQLAVHWARRSALLEMISSHDDMHEVASAIRDAQVCLEMMDMDDLLRVLEQLGMALEHIGSVQQVRWRNLY